MTVNEVYIKFIRSRKLNGLSKKTIESYKNFVGIFVHYTGPEKDLYSLSQNDLEDYIAYQVDRDISKNTFATYICHFKVFVRWVCENYDVNFTYKTIKVPKSSKKIVRIYSDSDIKEMFDMICYPVEWIERRNKAIIAFMLDSGIRQAEVCNLKHDCVFCDTERMIVYGKGDKERIVPLGRQTWIMHKFQQPWSHRNSSTEIRMSISPM